ncbi:MAG TPA: DNA translocase FtsK 4TM domain-containing protein [Polyangiaceae bacterium]|nr:DNA translocase FtsK 4TM domain-containing protein [Polyangiaceae bacterium]
MGVRLFSARNTLAAGSLASPAGQPPPQDRPSVQGFHGRLSEAAALLLFFGAAFLALALASYRIDPFDPTQRGSDLTGATGSLIASVLVQGFGVVAWLLPVDLALLGAPLFRGRVPNSLGYRVAADVLVGVVLAALVQVVAPELVAFGSVSAAGNVGMLFGELSRQAFSTLGSFLVGLTCVGLILIGRSSFSFIEWCRRSSDWTALGLRRLSQLFLQLYQAWSKACALRRADREALTQREAPRIQLHDKDEAILMHLEEEESDFIPFDLTGEPPLAISEALKAGLADHAALSSIQEEILTGAPPRTVGRSAGSGSGEGGGESESEGEGVGEGESESAGKRESSKARGRAAQPQGPKIVASNPAAEVKKAKGVEKEKRRGEFRLPASVLFQAPSEQAPEIDRAKILEHAEQLEKTLRDYDVSGKVVEIHPGPTVTTYEVTCEAGTKVSRVAGLADDLALGLSRKVRIIAPIPGKSRIGFELPNDERIPVSLRELIEDQRFEKLSEKAPLPVVLGRDIVGAPFYADLASMPHVIVAGATGAGKSVGLNVMLSSLLMRRTPRELRLLMIDPKVVELAPFDGIPHMLLPVVTDMKQAATALRWAVDEMERRYQLFANAGTKNITTFNGWVERVRRGELPAPRVDQVQAITPDGETVTVSTSKDAGDGLLLPDPLPYIVIVVDEFADLMMQQGKEVECSVARLAQKARAAGMHVVLATQRPSVDVITGMIKANFPSRIGFRVAQKVDSRTILDEMGAELLLGRGDMLVKLNGDTDTRRVQCPFVSEEEVSALTDYLRAQGAPEYNDAILKAAEEEQDEDGGDEPLDSRYDEAVRIVAETQRCSTSWLQRKMTIGYNRAAKIVEMMEKRGVVGPPNGAKDREVFVHPQ